MMELWLASTLAIRLTATPSRRAPSAPRETRKPTPHDYASPGILTLPDRFLQEVHLVAPCWAVIALRAIPRAGRAAFHFVHGRFPFHALSTVMPLGALPCSAWRIFSFTRSSAALWWVWMRCRITWPPTSHENGHLSNRWSHAPCRRPQARRARRRHQPACAAKSRQSQRPAMSWWGPREEAR